MLPMPIGMIRVWKLNRVSPVPTRLVLVEDWNDVIRRNTGSPVGLDVVGLGDVGVRLVLWWTLLAGTIALTLGSSAQKLNRGPCLVLVVGWILVLLVGVGLVRVLGCGFCLFSSLGI